LIRLGLIKEEVVGQLKNGCTTTSKLELPDELPSVEKALNTCGCFEGFGYFWA
jgi:hypothetical protein